MAGQSDTGRAAALALLQGVLDEKRLLSEIAPDAALAPAGKARARRLAQTTLRHVGRADALLKPHLRRLPPPVVRQILRMAVVEMLEEGAPPHGVVNAAVSLTRAQPNMGAMANFVNAVLRKMGQTDPARWNALPPQRLPGWLRGRLDSAWGRKAVEAMEAAHARAAPLDLTPRDGDAGALAAATGGQVLPTGNVRLAGGQVSALPGYDTGAWWVQDAAAALPVRLLAPQPGERIADLCAAPGGKTLQLAAAGARVRALDISAARLARLRENLARTGLAADVVEADVLTWQPDVPLDAVLLDAPCSATGTIRRHPDLPFVKTARGIRPLFDVQAQMIDRALNMVRPGGRLVYCTCSLLPEEGEAQLAAALERHPGLGLAPVEVDVPAHWRAPGGGMRLRPDDWSDIGGLDGFFMVALRKPG
ncbi:16S rRNA (cytosine967-C5)-methyltransferase [Rhodovulum imhoffii]|uniref:16S rRNA (Cytosine967-C5)-methyltransferase n=1 Tax=Rhodovulum imhoffii TaxID=365340 RepID=A0A2T5BV05_9RHOB|nr:transcription antitermination factor NusB [Rhodovulum imhoffii]MBK5934670.1 16S rRNA methyltransferase [Rhodovulum imhoffii]PTN03355.1 16S rRNA (cytosine967-C5)-methyltransferase [Rhodovulum imhoffii]